MYKKCKKILASVIVFTMMIANLSTVGIEINKVIAADLNSQNAKTNNPNVEFDTYFMEKEEKTYEGSKNIGEENKVIVEVKVKNAGYLKNTIIQFVNSNFKIMDFSNSDIISSIDTQKNEIMLKQIDADKEMKIEVPIQFENSENYDVSQFNMVNCVKMAGTYVDGNGKTHNVKKEIELNVNWLANAETILEAEITKFVPYDINNEKGLIVQTSIKSGIKDNVLPIKDTNIQIKIPSINNILPKDIKVSANNTKATNGEESGINFTQANYNIDEGMITINVENIPNDNGRVSWKKQAQDEYIISFIYPEEALNSGETSVALELNSSIKTYDAKQTILNANFQNTVAINEQLGNVVDFAVEANESISKGQIYANYDATEKEEIEYTQIITANIGFAELTDEIIINNNEDKFKTEHTQISSTVEENNNIYYKNISISKESFDKMLGENGFIKIHSGETLLETIDNTKTANSEGIIIIDLSKLNVNNIKIQTSKPLTEGKIEISILKAIKGEISYSKTQIANCKELSLNINGKAISNGELLVEQNADRNISLVEPQTQIELKTDTQNLSTIVKNENVEIRAILKTSSNYNKLFKNPKVTIELPAYIEQIDIKNVQLLYEDELTIEKQNYIVKPDGTKQIELELKGIQTKYSKDEVTGGANILITADITANNLTPNIKSNIKMIVENEGETSLVELPISFIAPVGIVTANKITNSTDSIEIMALTNDETSTLEVTAPKKDIEAEIQIINNYTNRINNVRILGRTLMQGTTDVETMQNLNNTFDAPMTSLINTNGLENVTIYYSENGNATEDLENTDNGWTETVADYAKVKSYLIVLNGYTMNIGDKVKFTYSAQIPENLNYSETVNSMYTVYFDNIQEEQIINDRARSRTVTLETGVAPTLQVKLESVSEENSVVREEQYVKFKAIIKNTGTVDAENVTINVTAPNGKIYTYRDEEGNIKFTEDIRLITNPEKQLVAEYSTVHTQYMEEDFNVGYEDSEEPEKIINIGTIKSGETVTKEYEIKIVNVNWNKANALLDSNSNTVLPEVIINNTVRVMAEDMQKEIVSNEYKLKADKGMLKLTLDSDKQYTYTLVKGDLITYSLKVEPLADLKNVVAKIKLSQGLELQENKIENIIISSDYEVKYNVTTDEQNNVIFNIEELPFGHTVNCIAIAKVGDIEGKIEAISTVTADNVEAHYSNEKNNKVSKLNITIKQLSPEKQYVKETEQITYIYEIENISDVYTNSFKFENLIPEGMKFVKAEIIRMGMSHIVTDKADEKFELDMNSFKANAKATIKVVMEAHLLPTGETEKEVTNYASIKGNDFETKTSNSVKTIIEYNEEAHKVDYGEGTNPDKPTNMRYKVSGLAFIDSNKNGQRDDNEELLSGVEVRLLNKNTNEVVKDIDTGSNKIVKTSSNGEYVFTNLENGEYLVVFIYNSYKYELTQYKKAGISNTINSDVINVNMQIDGKQTTVAISDTIRIINENARNIDIGLCESQKSDMKIDKYVSAITVTYGNTVKTYNYENEKIAKVEIPATELNKATVIIEYKIVVTNEGAIGNYVRKVVDYVPKDTKFNSELNRDWYQSSNGDLYNSSLANRKLESGESAELTLTLTKKMTDSNTGIVNNNAELYEVYNEEGKQDEDSTPANKVTNEDDISSADVVIGVKTGDAVTFTAMISVIICITIGISTYYIRKKVLRRM